MVCTCRPIQREVFVANHFTDSSFKAVDSSAFIAGMIIVRVFEVTSQLSIGCRLGHRIQDCPLKTNMFESQRYFIEKNLIRLLHMIGLFKCMLHCSFAGFVCLKPWSYCYLLATICTYHCCFDVCLMCFRTITHDSLQKFSLGVTTPVACGQHPCGMNATNPWHDIHAPIIMHLAAAKRILAPVSLRFCLFQYCFDSSWDLACRSVMIYLRVYCSSRVNHFTCALKAIARYVRRRRHSVCTTNLAVF